MEASLDKQAMKLDGTKDLELNIIDCKPIGDTGVIRNEYQDATENSSSFSGTVSGIEGSASSDAEVQSQLPVDNTSAAAVDGYAEIFRTRKRKLTDHWRSFIRPVMWRCNWIELQIKEFQSQASKYERELTECNHTKLFELEKLKQEGAGVKSLPFYDQNWKGKIMRRKKRNRVEEKTDAASYMSSHNVFSYFESRSSAAKGASMNDGMVKLDRTLKDNLDLVADEDPLLEDGNNSLEQILCKICEVQCRVHKLKGRIDMVVTENAGTAPSTNNLGSLMPCDALISSAPNPVSPPSNTGKKPVGHMYTAPLVPDYSSMPDVVFPKAAVLRHEDVMLLPQVEGSLKNDGQGISRHGSKEELHDIEEGKCREQSEKLDSTPPIVAREVGPRSSDQSTKKFRSISQIGNAAGKKRKRATRKGCWSKRSSG